MKNTVSVVILNWNGAGVTYDCLRFFYKELSSSIKEPI